MKEGFGKRNGNYQEHRRDQHFGGFVESVDCLIA
jgi:hypothetical protein